MGYAGCLFIASGPALWFRVMHRPLDAVRSAFVDPLECGAPDPVIRFAMQLDVHEARPQRSKLLDKALAGVSAAWRCMPSAVGPPSDACVRVRPAASGRRIRRCGCR